MTALQSFLSHDPLTKFLLNDLDATFFRPVALTRRAPQSNSPTAEVFESESHYYLRIDVPGIPKDDISVEVQDGQLVVSGERKSEPPVEGAKRVFSNRTQVKFLERFALPENADAEKIVGAYKDGVLSLTIEKRKKPEPVRIKLAGEA